MAKYTKEQSSCFVNRRRTWKGWEKATLWGRCAGRCERCNTSIISDKYSGDPGNFGEFAHIIAHSVGGNRSNRYEDYSPEYVDSIDNILVLCPACHTNIDKKEYEAKYTEEVLREMKRQHIEKIFLQTLPDGHEKRQVVIFTCPVYSTKIAVSDDDTREAMYPAFFPWGERAIRIEISSSRVESEPVFWERTQDDLINDFNRYVLPLLENGVKFAIFAIAPIPLLIQFGVLLRGTNSSIIYNLFRRPTKKWKWLVSDIPEIADFMVNRYNSEISKTKALVVSLSASIIDRVKSELGDTADIWEITIDQPKYDCIKSPEELSALRKVYLQVLEEASKAPGNIINVFVAAPNSAAVMLGMSYMPKCNNSLVIHDYISSLNKDIKTIEISSI